MLQMKLVIAMIAQRFQFTVAKEPKVTPNVQITLQPGPWVPAVLRSRQDANALRAVNSKFCTAADQ